jgi:glycine dehydrogenase subunit 1
LTTANPSGGSPFTFTPNTDDDQQVMLTAIGVADFEDLISDVPEAHRYPTLALPAAAHEMSLASELATFAATNYVPGEYACFLGSGAYLHYDPAVARKVASRGEFMTSYTPYQPEVAQG